MAAPAASPSPAPAAAAVEALKRRAHSALEDRSGRSVHYLVTDESLIGRACPEEGLRPEVDLGDHPEAGTVSRRHARLVRGEGGFLVEDLGSRNGTYLNGEALLPGVLRPIFENDELRLGAARFLFHHRRPGASAH